MRRCLVLMALLGASLLAAPGANAAIGDHNGIIFLHGYAGSGAQFESQKMRFVENGYADSWVRVIEYDPTPATPVPGMGGLNPVGIDVIEQTLFPRIDQDVAQMKADTGRAKVDIAAHSLGTKLMFDYLNSSPQRAANVGNYVNMDGETAAAPPGGVRTLALWGTKGPLSPPNRSIGGATNVVVPDSTHVQVSTSPVSFDAMFRFLTGGAPATSDIVPEHGPITLSGTAVQFPMNSGLNGATVQVWPVDQGTGQRTSGNPIATYQLGSDGAWGPVRAEAGRSYEFTLIRPGVQVHHFYYEPFLRSDHLIRLLESDALRLGGGAPSPNSVAMVVLRYKELWGDQGAENDSLTANGTNICNAAICPLSQLVNADFVHDQNQDGMTDTSKPDPVYSKITFATGADVFIPAQNPPVGKVAVTLRSRTGGPARTVAFPNFPSSTDVTSVQLNDFDQTATPVATRATCVRRKRFTFRIHQPRHGRIVVVDAYMNGHRIKHVRGHRVKRLTLKRPKKKSFRLVIVARWSSGHRTVSVRRFHRCGKTRPHTHVDK